MDKITLFSDHEKLFVVGVEILTVEDLENLLSK